MIVTTLSRGKNALRINGLTYAVHDERFWFGELITQRHEYMTDTREQIALLTRWVEEYEREFQVTHYDPSTHSTNIWHLDKQRILEARPYLIRRHRSFKAYGDIFRFWYKAGFVPNEHSDQLKERVRSGSYTPRGKRSSARKKR